LRGVTAVRDYVASRELLVNLTLRELRSKYKKSVLGWSWSLLNPVASVAIYTVIFSVFLKIQPPRGDPSGLKSFVLFLLCGLIPWNFVANCLTATVDSVVGNANLVKKVYFPRELLVGSTIASLLVTFCIELGVVAVILLVAGNMILTWLPITLLLMALLATMLLGVGLILSVWNVYFRDVKHFLGIAIQALFYSAPIVYPITVVPANKTVAGIDIPVLDLYRLNPLVRFVEAFRDTLYNGRAPNLGTIAYLVAWAVGALALGLRVFRGLEPRLAEEV
jgi:ABC-type polysaccharide/polyol phosphate export permease